MRTLGYLILTGLLLLAGCSEPDRPTISLYLAIQRGDLDQVERHIFWGTDINQMDPDGKRALHVAAANGKQIIVKTLLDHGGRIDSRDSKGHTALYYAIMSGRTQLADLLLSRGATLDASRMLLVAAQAGSTDRDVINYLVEHDADTEIRDDDGKTPLLLAVMQNNHRLLRHLVDRGADVNARDAQGNGALRIAKQRHFEDIAQLLKQNGAIEE